LGYDGAVRAAGLVVMLAAAACAREPAEAVCPALVAGDLVVTEVRGPQVPEDASGAWIELYNASGGPIDLLGIRVRFRSLQDAKAAGIPILVRRSLAAAARSYTVLGLFDDADPPPHVDYGFLGDFSAHERAWVDQGAVEVETCGALIDHAPYDLLPDKGTHSLGGAPDANRNDLPASWCTDATQVGATFPGTPRSQNIRCP